MKLYLLFTGILAETDYPNYGSGLPSGGGPGDYATDIPTDFTLTSDQTLSSTLTTTTATSKSTETSSIESSTVFSWTTASILAPTRPPPVCLENTAFGDIFVWDIEQGMDKPSPYSNFALEIVNFAGDTKDCQRECASFAGCYKEWTLKNTIGIL